MEDHEIKQMEKCDLIDEKRINETLINEQIKEIGNYKVLSEILLNILVEMRIMNQYLEDLATNTNSDPYYSPRSTLTLRKQFLGIEEKKGKEGP